MRFHTNIQIFYPLYCAIKGGRASLVGYLLIMSGPRLRKKRLEEKARLLACVTISTLPETSSGKLKYITKRQPKKLGQIPVIQILSSFVLTELENETPCLV